MVHRLGQFVSRRDGIVALAWGLLLAALLVCAPSIRQSPTGEDSALLPPDASSYRALRAMRDEFPHPPPVSVAAVVMERPGGLQGFNTSPGPAIPGPENAESDFHFVQRLTARLLELAPADHWHVLSPTDPKLPVLRENLLSRTAQPDGRSLCDAAVVVVDLPDNFVSRGAIDAVARIEQAVERCSPPPGLTVAVSGSAAYGRGYYLATETSLERTTWVTLVAVLLVLLLTYRAVLAAAISLVTVSTAVIISISILAIGARYGWPASSIVQMFTIVIGYGAGVDFSLFYLSRYHEELAGLSASGSSGRRQRVGATVRALVGVGPAVIASAATVAAGLVLMCLADFRTFKTAGPAVSISVVVSCLASLTLTPALACMIGAATFWPRSKKGSRAFSGSKKGSRAFSVAAPDYRLADSEETPDALSEGDSSHGFWGRLAGFTVAHPAAVLATGLAVLVPLAALGWREQPVYDTLADLPSSSNSVRGARMFQRHFPVGEMAPVRIMVRLDGPRTDEQWVGIAQFVDGQLAGWTPPAGLCRAQAVRSVAHPVGANPLATFDPGAFQPASNLLAEGIRRIKLKAFAEEVRPRYVGRDSRSARWDIAIDDTPISNRALASLDPLVQAVRDAVAGAPAGGRAEVFAAGETAQMADLRELTQSDFRLVGTVVVLVIALIVALFLRSLLVAAFVMAATVLSYGAALALTAWFFRAAFGAVGLDWKVEFFLFVILVAVGQDYNLFMLTRIREERVGLPLRPAVRRAITRTGAIISCCGLIMAATLGSLASSPLRLLQQLGAAFVLGLLIDTFLVRPLMVPAFVLLTGRSGTRPGGAT